MVDADTAAVTDPVAGRSRSPIRDSRRGRSRSPIRDSRRGADRGADGEQQESGDQFQDDIEDSRRGRSRSRSRSRDRGQYPNLAGMDRPDEGITPDIVEDIFDTGDLIPGTPGRVGTDYHKVDALLTLLQIDKDKCFDGADGDEKRKKVQEYADALYDASIIAQNKGPVGERRALLMMGMYKCFVQFVGPLFLAHRTGVLKTLAGHTRGLVDYTLSAAVGMFAKSDLGTLGETLGTAVSCWMWPTSAVHWAAGFVAGPAGSAALAVATLLSFLWWYGQRKGWRRIAVEANNAIHIEMDKSLKIEMDKLTKDQFEKLLDTQTGNYNKIVAGVSIDKIAEDIIKYVYIWREYYKKSGIPLPEERKNELDELLKGAVNVLAARGGPRFDEIIERYLANFGKDDLNGLQASLEGLSHAANNITETNAAFKAKMDTKKGKGNMGAELNALNDAIGRKEKAWQNLIKTLVPLLPGVNILVFVNRLSTGAIKMGRRAATSAQKFITKIHNLYSALAAKQIAGIRHRSDRITEIEKETANQDRIRAMADENAPLIIKWSRRRGGSRRKKSTRKPRSKRKTIRRKVVKKSVRKKSIRKTKKRKTKRMRR